MDFSKKKIQKYRISLGNLEQTFENFILLFNLIFRRIFSQKKGQSCTYCAQAIHALVLHVQCSSLSPFWLVPFSHSRSYAIDLLPAGCEWSEKWMSDVILVLYFSWNIYMLYIMYIHLLLYGGRKSAPQLSYGFNILDKLEGCPHENQISYGDMDFKKKVSKVTDFRL